MQYIFLAVFITSLISVSFGSEDEIECYSCRHDIYDGVPEGDENCEFLTGNKIAFYLHYNIKKLLRGV